MTTDKETPTIRIGSEGDLTGHIFLIGLFLIIVLCAGEPDLLDAIVQYVQAAANNCK